MNNSSHVVVFACNWDGLSCIEAAAHEGLSYPASVRIVRVSCLSRVHLGLILRAFELGAEGVMLLGCEPGECNYDRDSRSITREYEKAQGLLRLMGMAPETVILSHMSRGDGVSFVHKVNEFVVQVGGLPRPVPAVEAGKRETKQPSAWRFRIEG
jgi:F420-non-reducing hydrogenase iron-sulfur subunit